MPPVPECRADSRGECLVASSARTTADRLGSFCGSDSPSAEEKANPFAAPQRPLEAPYTTPDRSPFGECRIENVPTDVGSVLNYAVEIWKENLGLLVGVTVVIMCIDGALTFGTEMMTGVLRRTGQWQVASHDARDVDRRDESSWTLSCPSGTGR